MKRLTILSLFILSIAGQAAADELVWDHPSGNVWYRYYTSPYYALNRTTGEMLRIYCLDFNHEIAPPHVWEAVLRPLEPSNVPAFQYGDLDNAYELYLEAAWLFTQSEQAQLNRNNELMKQYQVAAWKRLVDSAHIADFQRGLNQSSPAFVQAVNQFGIDAANAVANGWTQSGWYVATGDPVWVADDHPEHQAGDDVQEFLVRGHVPEPSSVVLLATMLGALGLAARRGIARRTRR